MLDNILNDELYRLKISNKSIERAKELSLNDSKMIKILNTKLRA
jgi:hypothetical protein